MKIQDVMTSNVASANPHDTVEKTAKAMSQSNIGALPVCEGGNVVGIVTDRDITMRCVAQGKDARQACVQDIMTTHPVTANPTMDVHEAAKLMSQNKIRRLPVVDKNALVGMVALGDLAEQPELADNAGVALHRISSPSQPQ